MSENKKIPIIKVPLEVGIEAFFYFFQNLTPILYRVPLWFVFTVGLPLILSIVLEDSLTLIKFILEINKTIILAYILFSFSNKLGEPLKKIFWTPITKIDGVLFIYYLILILVPYSVVYNITIIFWGTDIIVPSPINLLLWSLLCFWYFIWATSIILIFPFKINNPGIKLKYGLNIVQKTIYGNKLRFFITMLYIHFFSFIFQYIPQQILLHANYYFTKSSFIQIMIVVTALGSILQYPLYAILIGYFYIHLKPRMTAYIEELLSDKYSSIEIKKNPI